jgi:DNA-binding NtrC family response regulator
MEQEEATGNKLVYLELSPCRGLRAAIEAAGWTPQVARDLTEARQHLGQPHQLVGLLVTEGIDAARAKALRALLDEFPDLEWVGAFGRGAQRDAACRTLILGRLFDHHTLPVDLDRLLVTLGHARGRALLRLPSGSAADERPQTLGILGDSEATCRLRAQIRRVAKTDAPILISGESGCGKELTAHAIHELSARSQGPLVALNCGAMTASLIQSELFGHTRGSFTGALRDKRGLIEAADGGTLFLDEVGDLPLELQTNMLRFLQEGTIKPVGATRDIRVDVRVIAATNVPLEEAVRKGSFREDLFYRLNVLPVHVPPLRERVEDVEPLASHFFRQFANDQQGLVAGFSYQAIAAMQAYRWPGNIRELINRVRRAVVMAEARLITPEDLGLGRPSAGQEHATEALLRARSDAERAAIRSCLRGADNNLSLAARSLGVSRMTLYRLLAKHGIER